MMKQVPHTAHRIIRVIIGILMILIALNVGRMSMLFVIFSPLIGGIESYEPGLLLLGSILAVALTTIAAPFFIRKGISTPSSSLETVLALVNVVSGYIYLSALPASMDYEFETEASTISMYLYIISSLALVGLLLRGFVRKLKAEPRTVATEAVKPDIGKITFVLSLFVIGFLLTFMLMPLVSLYGSMLGIIEPNKNESWGFWPQMMIYAFIIAVCAIVAFLVIIILRKIRKHTTVTPNSHTNR